MLNGSKLRKINKYIQILIIGLILLYLVVCTILYFIQENLLFFPTKLSRDYTFSFEKTFEEINHQVDDHVSINSILFKSKEMKGVVFFLHGNGGSIEGWGQGASLFVDCGYDVMYLDYRGYGKSSGHIESEEQLVNDAQIVYDYLKNRYTENRIILSGTSIGTGIATEIASSNHPQKLILNSPYYSLKSLIKEKVPIIPDFIIKYSFKTYKQLEKLKCPVIIFHGGEDELIPLVHSTDLKKKYQKVDLNIIEGYGHNDLSDSEEYRTKMTILLK